MNTKMICIAFAGLAFASCFLSADLFAQRGSLDRFGGAGGARSPGMGGRPNLGSPMSRPSAGPGFQGSRPAAVNRPSMGFPSGQRPSLQPPGGIKPQVGGRPPVGNPGINRPTPGISRPSPGINRPSPGFNPATGSPIRPNITRPSTPPAGPNQRPSITRPSFPTNRPAPGVTPPSIQRPNRPPLNQPNVVRPSVRPFPGGDRPANKPSLPGIKPPSSQRPSLRPPTVGPRPAKPSISPNRPPVVGNRPPGDRPSLRPPTIRPIDPGFGRPTKPVHRPPWAGHNPPGPKHPPGFHPPGHRPPVIRPPGPGWDHGHHHRPPHIGGHRPPGWRPGYDYWTVIRNLSRVTTVNYGTWAGYSNWGIGVSVGYPSYGQFWYSNYVSPWHRSWYNGCWTGNAWYTPFVPGSYGWGVDASYYGWGLHPTYVNPYYVVVQRPVYDYSQPIVIQQVPTADQTQTVQSPVLPQDDPANQQAIAAFEQAITAFQARNYQGALNLTDQALRGLPHDPLIHEVRALTLFAQGEYRPAAAILNSLLATSPGMDWSSMSQLYGDVDEYTKHLKALQTHIASHPHDSAALFLLAYHYLVLQEIDAAVKALEIVVDREPTDVVARKMLQSLSTPADDEDAEAVPADQESIQEVSDAAAQPELSIAGNWTAVDGQGTKIHLTIDDESKFTWVATPTSGQPTKVEGAATSTFDTLVLESPEQGTMVAQVQPIGADQFRFSLVGAQASDEGVVFNRVK